MIRQPFVYLATPYRHEDPQVMHRRFERALAAMLRMWQVGYPAYSPIAYTHPISVHLPRLQDHEYQRFDDRILAVADEVWVLQLPGWEQSLGVQHEMRLAETLGKHVRYVPPEAWTEPLTWETLAAEIANWGKPPTRRSDSTGPKRKPPKWWWKQAIDMVKNCPGMSDHAIAKAIGIAPSTLSRDKQYQQEANRIRQSKTTSEEMS